MRSGVRAGGTRLSAEGPLQAVVRAHHRGHPTAADGLGASGRRGAFLLCRRALEFHRLPLAGARTGPSPRTALGQLLIKNRLAPAHPPSTSRVLLGSPEFPSTSKSGSEPVVVAVQQLVEDPSDVFRVEVRAVAPVPQRLLHAASRGESRLSLRAGLVPLPRTSALEPGSYPSRARCLSPRLNPPSKLAPAKEPVPRGQQRRQRAHPLLVCSSGQRQGSRGASGIGRANLRLEVAHSPHSDAYPGDEQSHASGMCEDGSGALRPVNSSKWRSSSFPSRLGAPLG